MPRQAIFAAVLIVGAGLVASPAAGDDRATCQAQLLGSDSSITACTRFPIDGRIEQPGDLRLDTIELTDVLAQMEAEPRVNLVFLDACRDNPRARSFARSLGARSTTVGQGFAMVQSAIGTMIANATQPDAVALDGDGRNSPFTTALLKHIATPNLDIGNIMRRVRADVIAATSQRQVPWDPSSLIGDVVLVQ